MSERPPRIVLFEGPQGSGKTSATMLLTEHEYQYTRCIPTGEELIHGTDEANWTKSLDLMSSIQNDYKRYSVDRCLWSIVAYKMRTDPGIERTMYQKGREDFLSVVRDSNYSIAIITSTVEDVLHRQDSDTVVAITDVYTAQQEIDAYSRLADYLDQDGFPLHNIINTGVPKNDFLKIVLERLSIT